MIRNIPRNRNCGDARRGIVLMIMLSLLALFTVMAVTFVVASGQHRRGANVAARAEQSGDPFDVLLQQAMMQIVRGSTHPHSAIGPHGLLEDMYGNADAVTGCVVLGSIPTKPTVPTPNPTMTTEIQSWAGDPMFLKMSGVSFGWDRQPGNGLSDDDNNGVVDDISELGASGSDDRYLGSIPAHPFTAAPPGSPSSATQVVDNSDNFYSGRVITFVSGPAAGQSCYIVRSKVFFTNPGQPQAQTVLFVTPPQNGKKPANFDRFVINGRPFNGTGFGSTPYVFDAAGNPVGMKPARVTLSGGQDVPNPKLRMLDQPYHSLVDSSNNTMRLSGKIPIAYTPNPVDPGYREYLAKYGPLIDADEDYDIPDAQNMLLAGRQWNGVTRKFETIAPSLHRPDLVNYVMRNAALCPQSAGLPYARWINIPPAIRRRIILRPDPVDHYDYTQENVLNPINSDGWTPGEPFVDVNGNGVWDPFVASLGGSESYTDANGNGGYDVGDRAYYNTSWDALRGPWDVDNDGDGAPDSIWVDLGAPVTTDAQGRLVKPLFAIMVIDLDGRINVNAHGTWQELQDSEPDYAQVGVFPGATPTWAGISGTTNGLIRPSSPTPQLYGAGHFATEERNVIGPYAYGTSVNAGLTSFAITRMPLVQSPLIPSAYPGMTDAQVQNIRWAGAYTQDFPFNSYQAAYSATTSTTVRLTLTTTGGRNSMNGLNPMRIEPAFGQGYGVHDVNLASTIWAADNDGLPHLGGSGTTLSTKPSRVNRHRTFMHRRYGEDHLSRLSIGATFAPGARGVEPRPGLTRTLFSDSTYQSQFSGYYSQAFTVFNDDNIPAPPTGAGNPLGNSGRDAFNAVVTSTSPLLLLSASPSDTRRLLGDYGTPGDFDSNGAVGLDLFGQPLYLNMGLPDETIDEPSETVLNRRYFPMTLIGNPTTTAGYGNMAYRDAPYTPAELERLLRIRDPGSNVLPKRLDSVFGDDDWYMQYLVTTESWDIPCPHVAPTAELAGALKDLQLPVSNPTIGDLLKARFYLAKGGRNASGGAMTALLAAQLATVSMRSYLAGAPNNVSRLLSPDLGVGLRMDVNAPFGNSYDDNNNGVVDEAGENDGLLGNLPFDGNRDGVASVGLELARQQYAKELYCLMMLLIDENYVMPVQQGLTLPSTIAEEIIAPSSFKNDLFPALNNKTWPGAETVTVMKAKRWLTAHRIAQWAVNAVDFRDRDSIMTPFEFDVDPFNNNDASPTSVDINNPGNGGTWDVDANLTTDENDSGNNNWFRGLVWGCEYPDVILTETMAFHDRRTQNTMYEVEAPAPMAPALPISGTNKLTRAGTSGRGRAILTDTTNNDQSFDPHWDQTRVPEGSAFIELYATGNPNNPVKPRELYTNDQLDLSRYTGNSPVWRLAITQGRVRNQGAGSAPGTLTQLPQNDVAMRLAQNPGTCSLDPADAGFSILPWVNYSASTAGGSSVTIERVVTFCSSSVVSAGTISATLGLNVTTTASPTAAPIDTYSAYSGSTVPVGRYVLVTPHRMNVTPTTGGLEANLESVTLIGDTMREALSCTGVSPGNFKVDTAAATGAASTARITPPAVFAVTTDTSAATRTNSFLATSPNGSVDYPIHQHIDASVTALGNLVNFDTTPTVNYNQIQTPIPFPCVQATGTSASGFIPQAIGFNISEPTLNERQTSNPYRPYALPPLARTPVTNLVLGTYTNDWNANLTRTDKITKTAATLTDPQQFDDVPWDGYYDSPSDSDVVYNPQLPSIQDQTTLRYKSVFLQRLADPTRPWDRYTNPYLTVDWMPFDLTVFNGAPFWLAPAGTDRTEQLAALSLEHMREPGALPNRTNPPTAVAAGNVQAMTDDNRVRFGSRQRGGPRWPFKGNYSNMNLWGQTDWLDFSMQGSTLPPLTNHVINNTPAGTANYRLGYYNDRVQNQTSGAAQNPSTAAPYYFYTKWQDPCQHTLGYINENFHYRLKKLASFNPLTAQVTWPMIRPASRTGGDINAPYGWLMGIDFKASPDRNYATDSLYVGAPWRPFNWLTWNNRPYSSAMELMLVPAAGPARLLHEYDMRRTILPANPTTNLQTPWEFTRSANHYLPSLSAPGQRGFLIRPPFGHLLNFFESSSAVPASWGIPAVNPSAQAPLIGSLPMAWPSSSGWPQSANVSTNSGQTYMAGNFFRIFEFLHVPTRFSGLHQLHRNTTINAAFTTSASVTEHPSWPFIAPFNALSLYREPGRVNLNTMPLMRYRSDGSGGQPETSMANSRGPIEAYQGPSVPYNGHPKIDFGGAAWRSVTNEFHPKLRRLIGESSNAGNAPRPNLTPIFRAGQTFSSIGNRSYQPWNPSQTTSENFFNLYASLHSDNPVKDPRGPDGFIGLPDDGSAPPNITLPDDTLFLPLDLRCDPQRAALFNNPFRSYVEGYGAVAPTVPSSGGQLEPYVSSLPSQTAATNPFLQIDATLLRRRDTTWNPWDASPQMWSTSSASSNSTPVQVDPAFDPLFTLNFPRPCLTGQTTVAPFTGYSINMLYRAGVAAGTSSDNVFGSSANSDNYLSRTTDYRNTDRSAFFRYQLYNKLGTIATTRSNVYAIWVTVGYFEVEKVHPSVPLPSQEVTGFSSSSDLPVQYRFPDGYKIVRELGSDTGEVERHKAFGIFDRTIPVGFLRGENLNADQGFLVRRVLY